MPEDTGEPQPHDADNADTLAAHRPQKGKPHWGVGAVGEDKFREPSLRELADRGQLLSVGHVVWLAAVVAIVAAVTFADRATTPYLLVAPGSVQELSDQIEFAGDGVPPVSSAGGQISLVTVETSQATIADHFYVRMRSDLALIPMERTRTPGASDADERRRDEAMMMSSQEIAEYVAFRHLGYEARFVGDGALVEGVSTGTAAPGKIEPGDVIVSIDAHPIKVSTEIRDSIGSKTVGDSVKVGLQRQGNQFEVDLPLSKSTDGADRPVVGVLVTTLNPRVETPFDARFNVENIGGPSGGLAFALEIVDSLSPGDLTAGKSIVATGAISPNGAISPVGGVYQKAIAASRVGADYFLVPAANYAEIGSSIGGTKVVPVESLDSAVEFLKKLKSGTEPKSPRGVDGEGPRDGVTISISP